MSLAIPRMPDVGDVLLERYRLEAIVGQGGMGVVFRARQLPSDARVAIKILTDEALSQPESLPRLVNEARAAMTLKSQHVVKVHDVGVLDQLRPFVVMELLEGADLGQLVERRKHLPIAEAVDYVIQAADAVAEAHANGIIHRDLKPSNLFLTSKANTGSKSNVIKILDFGISKVSGSLAVNQVRTATGALLGTPQYMSPEQLKSSRDVDARADIWSLGVILYELIAGKPPFDANHGGIFALVLTAEFTPLRETRPNVPEALDRVVTCCLRKSRDERFPDVGALVQALAPFASPDGARLAMQIRRGAAGAPALPGAPDVRKALGATALMKDRPPLPAPSPAPPVVPPFNPHELPPLPLPPSQQQIETVPSSSRLAVARAAGTPAPSAPVTPAGPYVASHPPIAGVPPARASARFLGALAIALVIAALAGVAIVAIVLRLHERTTPASAPAASATAATPAPAEAVDAATTTMSIPPAAEGASAPTEPSPTEPSPAEATPAAPPQSSEPAPSPRATGAPTSSILEKRK